MSRPLDASEAHVFHVDGKRVKLKDRLSLKAAPQFPRLLKGIEEDYRNIARLGVLVVEEWDFDGPPSDMRSWDELDILSEIPVFAMEIGRDLNARMERAGVPKG